MTVKGKKRWARVTRGGEGRRPWDGGRTGDARAPVRRPRRSPSQADVNVNNKLKLAPVPELNELDAGTEPSLQIEAPGSNPGLALFFLLIPFIVIYQASIGAWRLL